ncbi:MAG TPA: NUDIX domain-containing protein [Balneolaceae bacterium]
MKAVIAAGGAVFRTGSQDKTIEVLLIYRRGVWDLPKGKREEKESIEECATREVVEEIGTKTSPEVIAPLVKTYHEYERDGKNYAKITHWFVMKFPGSSKLDFQPETEEGIEQVKWITISDAKKRLGYENLVKVLESLEKYFDKK